jgi:hypothetical protein
MAAPPPAAAGAAAADAAACDAAACEASPLRLMDLNDDQLVACAAFLTHLELLRLQQVRASAFGCAACASSAALKR